MLRPRAVVSLLFAVAALGNGAQADSSGNLTIESMLQEIPPCALPCVLDGIQAAKCPITDVTLLADCMCTNVTMQSDMSTCVQTSCHFDDQVLAVNVQTRLCAPYPKDSRVSEIKNTAIATIAIVLPIATARCAVRFQIGRTLWLDDWMTIVATLFLLAVGGTQLAGSLLGFGLHYWTVDVNNATRLLQLFYSAQIFYIAVQVFAKVAILVLYGRVFNRTRWFKLAIRAGIIFMFGHGAIFIMVIIFQCTPVAAVWDRSLAGKCLNVNAVGYVGAVLAVVEDIVLIVLPMPELWKLQLEGRKRVSIAIMFGAASFATVASMIRLKYIVQFSKTYDTTWDNVDIVVWSMIELLCAVVCGSLPPLRPWFGPLFPSISITWKKRSGQPGSRSNPSRTRASNLPSSLDYHDHKHNPSYDLSVLGSGKDRGNWDSKGPYPDPRIPEPAALNAIAPNGHRPRTPNYFAHRRADSLSSSSENHLIMDHSQGKEGQGAASPENTK
ncbi:hypothetical protein GQ53DRAFT_674412 [Thozetella sp. PMI_491]|nr:hypothetical protein GQ53DRAFT_674412 [Thozetella sp. PMI_491]